MSLHIPTLVFVTGLVIAFSGLLLITAGGTRQSAASLRVWGVAMLLGAAGLVVAVVGQSDWRTSRISDGMFITATAVSWAAARMFAERRTRWAPIAAAPALWVLISVLPLSDPALLAAACAIGAAYTVAMTAELLHGRAEDLASRAPAVALLMLHAAIYGARAVDAVTGPTPAALAQLVSVTLLLESLLHTVGMSFLLLALVKERGELRSSILLRQAALIDGLTGVANRRHFDEHLLLETRRSRRSGTPLALLLVDVDHFKAYNDTFGHPQGDECLRRMASAMAKAVHRPGDLVARYGGEEFAVILAGADLLGAIDVAEAIRAEIARLAITHSAPWGRVSVSVGVAALPPTDPTLSPARLIGLADAALYDAKGAGRNTVRVADRRTLAFPGEPAAKPSMTLDSSYAA